MTDIKADVQKVEAEASKAEKFAKTYIIAIAAFVIGGAIGLIIGHVL